MGARLYKRIFYKYWNESGPKMYLDGLTNRCLMGLMTWKEKEKEGKKEFNLFKRKFIEHFTQVKLKELK